MTIKEMRTETGMTQKQLAELLDVPRRTLQNWELGTRECPQYIVALIEYFLRSEGYLDKEET